MKMFYERLYRAIHIGIRSSSRGHWKLEKSYYIESFIRMICFDDKLYRASAGASHSLKVSVIIYIHDYMYLRSWTVAKSSGVTV